MSKYKIIEMKQDLKGKNVEEIMYEGENCFILFGEGTQSRHIRPSGQLMIDDKKCFKQGYLDTLLAVQKQYQAETGHVVIGSILVEVDMSWELTEKTTLKSRRKIDIRRTTGVEKTYTGAQYVLKLKQWWLEKWSIEQTNTALLSQLLRINPEDASIIDFDEDNSSHMIITFGAGYLDENVAVPDILTTKVKLKGFQRADRQVTIDDVGQESEIAPVKEDSNVVPMKKVE